MKMGTGKPVPRRTCGFHCCWDNTYDHLRSPKHIWGCLQSSPTLYYCPLLEGLVTEKPFVAVHNADNPLRSSWPRLCKIRTDLMPLWCNHNSLKQQLESYQQKNPWRLTPVASSGIRWPCFFPCGESCELRSLPTTLNPEMTLQKNVSICQ